MIETHIHKKTGNVYRLLLITNEESDSDKFPETAVYVDGEGRLWSRPMAEFNERFEEIK